MDVPPGLPQPHKQALPSLLSWDILWDCPGNAVLCSAPRDGAKGLTLHFQAVLARAIPNKTQEDLWDCKGVFQTEGATQAGNCFFSQQHLEVTPLDHFHTLF